MIELVARSGNGPRAGARLRFWVLATTAATGCRTATDPTSARPAYENGPNVATARASHRGDSIPLDEFEGLAAFAVLYGCIRFFHPSAAAAALDWDAFAASAVAEIPRLRSRGALRNALIEAFAPIAPTLRIYHEGDAAPAREPAANDARSKEPPVFWRHLGFGVHPTQVFRSSRTGWYRSPRGGESWASASNGVATEALRGRTVRLSASVRVAQIEATDAAVLWLRVDRPGGAIGFFDNMDDRPITGSRWARHEIVGEVAADAVSIRFGGAAIGVGAAWFDDFRIETIEADGSGVALPFPGGRFEGANPLEDWSIDARAASGFDYSADTRTPFEGHRSLKIARIMESAQMPEFDDAPNHDELVDVSLGAGLRAMFPLVLPGSDAKGTARRRGHREAEVSVAAESGAAVIAVWNVVQHFHPYRDLFGDDWVESLRPALADAQDDLTREDAAETLERLLAGTDDGHAHVDDLSPDAPSRRTVDAALVWADAQVVVQHAADAVGLRRGDIILEVDGVTTERKLVETTRMIAGSPQLERTRAIDQLLVGRKGTSASILVRRSGRTRRVEAPRVAERAPNAFVDLRPLERLARGIYYVDLRRVDADELRRAMGSLAAMQGIVFDLRGYPAGLPGSTRWVLEHLLERPEHDRWMLLEKIVRPRLSTPRTEDWLEFGWDLEPKAPHICARVALLTDAHAISQAESIAGYFESLHLGEIVGEATAGTNGDVFEFPVAGGFRVRLTGLRVTKHDGSRHYGIGTLPTIPATPTVEGLRRGDDEMLSAALRALADTPPR